MQAVLRLMAAVGAAAAPALFAQMAAVQSSQGQPLPAPAYRSIDSAATPGLPPPPYALASGEGGQTHARIQSSYDRYGGVAAHIPAPQLRGAFEAAGAAAYASRRLSWAGKVDAPVAPQRSALGYARYVNSPSSLIAPRQPNVQTTLSQPALPPPPAGWSYVPPIGPAPVEPSAPPAAPRSIYDPLPSVAAAPVLHAAAAPVPAGGARHYSVHREFGIEPDPIPLPPQFFGPTADLTQPETPEPARRSVSGDGKPHNAIQPADGQ